MINWFEIVLNELAEIKEQQKELRAHLGTSSIKVDANPYGDFPWLEDTVPVPKSTLRIWSAAGKIPGTVKFGKRVLYEKAVVLNWLQSQTRTLSNAAIREQDAEAQFTAQHNRRGGRSKAA